LSFIIPFFAGVFRFGSFVVRLFERDRLEFCLFFRSSSCSITIFSVMICPSDLLSTVRFAGCFGVLSDDVLKTFSIASAIA
jgi:hypothetical protein